MPRAIVLGNQTLLVNIDSWLQVRDVFYPHVGIENHVQGNAHRIGLVINDSFTWLHDWELDVNFERDTLVSHATASHDDYDVTIDVRDCVHCDKDIFMRKLNFSTTQSTNVTVLFFHDYCIYGNQVGDTAFYDGETNTIIHYKRKRYFLINAIREETCASCNAQGDIDTYTVHKVDNADIWEDMRDGTLDGNPVAQGNVASACGVDLTVNDEETLYYWMTVGKNREDVHDYNTELMHEHPDTFFSNTQRCWEGVVNAHGTDFKDLSDAVRDLYKRSVLTVITNIDHEGAIVASNDSDILKFNKDTYSYCWPRDGAFVSMALDRAGYHAYTKGFFDFCSDVQSDKGCLLHKYNPDRSVGSTWHPWVKNGEPHLPIQEDETALPIYAGWHHYQQHKNEDFARDFYDEYVKQAADFLTEHREGNLPNECYDLWEEREGVFTYTTATVIAGLQAAARFARHFDNPERADQYVKVASDFKSALTNTLWSDTQDRFARGLSNGELDATPEMSTFAVFALDVLEADDPKVTATMQALEEHLRLDTDIGGFARYDGDTYHRVSDDLPGNPWIITTLWYCKWCIATAETMEELQQAQEIIEWVVDNATTSGLLPEQLHPHTGEPLSVSPLTWSHATFIDVVHDYLERFATLQEETT